MIFVYPLFCNSLSTISTFYTIPYGLGAAGRLVPILSVLVITEMSELQEMSTKKNGLFFFSSITTLLVIIFPFYCSTRVSNELGAGRPGLARPAVYATMFLSVAETSIVSTSLVVGRRAFGYIFSDDKEVVEYVTRMAPLVCVSVILFLVIQYKVGLLFSPSSQPEPNVNNNKILLFFSRCN